MKKGILTTLIFGLLSFVSSAQTTIMNIYQNNGNVIQVPINTIDSITFTIGIPGTLATITTSPIDSITSTSAICGGTISNSGGTTITQRGVCWSTSSNPSTADSMIINGAGAGSFTVNLDFLLPNTTYYVRAFAINSAGTAYGNELIFTTSIPSLGQSYQGGIIAYMFQSGDLGYDPNVPHGIIVANQDLPVKYTWGSFNPTFYAQSFQNISNVIGKGKMNTDTILAVGTLSSQVFPAAQAARNYTNGIYNDWFLPSQNELLVIKSNLANNNIGNFNTVPDNTGVLSTGYWSSSVMTNFVGANAPIFAPNNSTVCGCAVFESYYVRPARYF